MGRIIATIFPLLLLYTMTGGCTSSRTTQFSLYFAHRRLILRFLGCQGHGYF